MSVLKIHGPSGDWGLYYEVIEKSVPYTTVFVHGELKSHDWFIPTIENFTLKKSRAILLDWRGCGRSSPPNEKQDMNIEQLATDLNTLLDKLGVEDCNVVGHDVGGLISLEMIRQKPERFGKIVLLNSLGPKLHPNIESATTDETACKKVGEGVKDLDTEGDFFKKVVRPNAVIAARNIGYMLDEVLSEYEGKSWIKELPHSALIVHGQEDDVVPLSEAELLSRALPNSRLKIIEGHGHCLNAENPKKFADLIETFFTSDPVQ